MNINTAQTILNHVGQIARIVGTFQARFGRDYKLSDTTSGMALDLYRQAMAEQAQIASLLEPQALTQAYSRYGKWWDRRDMLDTSMVNALSQEAITLVERCAYVVANGETAENAPSLLIVQQSIAGMLHPSTRPLTVGLEAQTQEAV